MKPEKVLSPILSLIFALWLLAGCGGGPTPAPTPVPATPTEATAEPVESGFITGRVHGQAPPTPAMVVYAVDHTTGSWSSIETEPADGEAPFTLEVPPGDYQVFAFARDGDAPYAGYSEDGLALSTVTVAAGQTVADIMVRPPSMSACGPTFGLPASPDGRFLAIDGPAKDCAVNEDTGAGMANPASVFCEEQGGLVDIRTEDGGEAGYCVFPDGSECEEWAFFRGECLPVGSIICHDLLDDMAQALGVEMAITVQAPFEDFVNGTTGTGCRLTATGTGQNFENIGVVYEQVTAMLQSRNWLEDMQYAGGGPTGLLTGYRQGDGLCLFTVEWAPSPEADCPADQPISACELSPEQMLYTVTLNCMQDNTVALPKTEPERIEFAPGATSSRVQGTLPAGGLAQYVLAAMAGQEMTVNLLTDDPVGAVLVIWGLDGTVLISDHAGATSWSGELPATQDYYIDVHSVTQFPINYTLEVIIPPPANASTTPDVLPLEVPAGFEVLLDLDEPLMLPPDFPVEANQPPIVPYVITAESGQYEVNLDYGADCHGAGACHYGSLTGKRVNSNQPESTRNYFFEPDRAQPVTLDNNIQGYFIEAQCGANCDDARVFWIVDGFQYMIGLKGGSQTDVASMANAAITNSLRSTAATDPSNMAIEFFTIDVEDNTAGGKNLVLTWQTTGVDRVEIWSGQGYTARMWEAEPNGTLTIEYGPDEAYNEKTFNLIAYNNRGDDVSQYNSFQFPCEYTLFFDSDPNRCASHEAGVTAAAEQPFEHGRMLWLKELRYRPERVIENSIVVLYEDGTWERFEDTWQPGQPESDPAIVPTGGLVQPVRGFGKLWRDPNLNLREQLGWGLAEEQDFEAVWQDDTWFISPSAQNDKVYIRTHEEQIIKLYGPESGTWEVITVE